MQQKPLSSLKELRVHGTQSFPFAVYGTHTRTKGTMVKHHWHEEIEILHFFGGDFRLRINMEEFEIHSECMYFINPGELHGIFCDCDGGAKEEALVFHGSILNFDSCDAAQLWLIQPLTSGQMHFPRCIYPDHPAYKPIRQAFSGILCIFNRQSGCDAPPNFRSVTDDPARQLYVRAHLLNILGLLSEHGMFTATEKNHDRQVESVKIVLTYIQENYKNKLYIRDLAGQVNMNEQYFCRFFKKIIGRSPMEYVNEYRIKQARKLLKETELPVMEVCLECGYLNLGNFLREFKRQTSVTPMQYRKKHRT